MNQHIYDEVEEIIKSESKEDVNIMHILGKSYDENSHSAMICRLLNVKPYRKCFLSDLDIDLDGEFELEHSTEQNRRIDIYLETNDTIIAIENKIFSGEQPNQISDYWEYISERKTVF